MDSVRHQGLALCGNNVLLHWNCCDIFCHIMMDCLTVLFIIQHNAYRRLLWKPPKPRSECLHEQVAPLVGTNVFKQTPQNNMCIRCALPFHTSTYHMCNHLYRKICIATYSCTLQKFLVQTIFHFLTTKYSMYMYLYTKVWLHNVFSVCVHTPVAYDVIYRKPYMVITLQCQTLTRLVTLFSIYVTMTSQICSVVLVYYN